MRKTTQDTAAAVLGALAASLWLGGLLVLGAVAAPIVFQVVPAPASGDAMTQVFRRFDRVALACAAVVGLAEVARARAGGVGRADLARAVSAALGAGCALVLAAVLSPAIAELHAAGAVRGAGPLGERLDVAHGWATTLGKIEAIAVAVVLALHVVPRSRDAGK